MELKEALGQGNMPTKTIKTDVNVTNSLIKSITNENFEKNYSKI